MSWMAGTWRARLGVALAAGVAFSIAAATAHANTYTVGTTADPASPAICPSATATNCSLRQLINFVHAHPFAPDTINVPAGTYTLQQGALLVNDSMAIVGAGVHSTVIQQIVPGSGSDTDRTNAGSRVFDISAVTNGATPTVTISGVEVTGGDATPAGGFFGGDIRSSGNLTLSQDWITNGFACSGGGVGNNAGTLTIESSLVSGNHSACINNNGDDSGGVENFGTPASGSTPDLPGHLVINNSTITGNDARLVGGVFSWADDNNTLTITNSTIAGNVSQDEGGFPARLGSGGGLGVGNGTVILRNTILAGNLYETSGSPTLPSNCLAGGPGITSQGHNIDSGHDCGLSGPGDLINTNPLLGPLRDNGGPTMTLAIGPGSPALDQVPPTGAGCPATDQRGVTRPQGRGCDIGAFELQVPPVCTGATATTAAGGSTVTIALPCTESAAGPLTLAIVQGPAHGALGPINAGTRTITYSPAPGFAGVDAFTYTGTDTGGTSAPAQVTVTVPPPPPPVCAAVSAATPPGGGTITIHFACTATSAGALSFAVTSGPRHGSLTHLRATAGTVRYTSARNFTGKDRFTYTGTASGGTSARATVSITIPPPPRLAAVMLWNFGLFARFNTVQSLVATNVPSGARAVIECTGRGCRHHVMSIAAFSSATQPACAKHKRCTKPKPKRRKPGTHVLTLTGHFAGWHLATGTRLQVSIIKAHSIGKVYIFRIRGLEQPSVQISCVAPGSTAVGRGC
jgi:hypothetical protein